MAGTITNEQQIKINLTRAAKSKGYTLTPQAQNLLYLKYIQSAPGTTYLQVINANTAFLTKDCGCR